VSDERAVSFSAIARFPVSTPARTLSASAQRVQDALAAAGIATTVIEYATSARTSAEAAAVLGCTIGEIAKSLVFRLADGGAVLVIASGANRVDEA
jgi:prolyl-tRNA editing enzyme YbaK/EbsC (Cys-tRNA(Pro) deacylase)